MIALKSDDELAVSDEDVMLSLPVPAYAAKRLSGLYRMNYPPHITLAMGKRMFSDGDLDDIRANFKEISPFRITLKDLSVIKTPEGNMLWANADIPPEVQYKIDTEIPFYHLGLNANGVKDPWPYVPFNFRPHVTLRYRKRPIRWLPKMPEITWVQRWVEVVKGDNAVERIVLRGNTDTKHDSD